MDISVVTPVYNSAECLPVLVERVARALAGRCGEFEIIMVDDGSSDHSWNEVKRLAASDPRVKGIKLTRNCGQHAAIMCGLAKVRGKNILVMDCDLQDPPEEIAKFLDKMAEGFTIVMARRRERRDSFLKRFESRLFYALYWAVSGTRFDHRISNYSLCHEDVVARILASGRGRFSAYPHLLLASGIKTGWIDVEHPPRHFGKGHYTLKKRLALAMTILFPAPQRRPPVCEETLNFDVTHDIY